eukprot:GEMP01005042.1.p1 GENE.GEMP01005042.1~~GEMP01005042.1.p1  ORF type:complete len:926 (+),score=166.26 GEMP01005042.1:83-2779(+)
MTGVVRFYSDAPPPRHQEAIHRCVGVDSILTVEQCVYLVMESKMSDEQWLNLYLLFDYARPKSSLAMKGAKTAKKTKVVEISYRKPLRDPWAIRVHHELRSLSFPVLCVARSFRYLLSNANAVRAIVSTFPATTGHLSGCIFHDGLTKLLCEPNPPLETTATSTPHRPATRDVGKAKKRPIKPRANRVATKESNPCLNLNTISKRLLASMSLPSSCFECWVVEDWAEPLVAQNDFVGPFQLPMANFRVEVDDLEHDSGRVVAYGSATFNHNEGGGESSYAKHRVSHSSLARLALTEAVGKLAFAKILRNGLEGVTASVTFKWKQINPIRAKTLSNTKKAYAVACQQLGVIMGKSEVEIVNNGPPEVIVELEAIMPNVINKVTQDLKWSDGSQIFAIDLARCRKDGIMDVDIQDVKVSFDSIQRAFDLIYSGHVSGRPGILACVSEMALTGGIGVSMDAHGTFAGKLEQELFRDGMQLVAEVLTSDVSVFRKLVPSAKLIALTQEELSVCSDVRDKISLGRVRRQYLRHFFDSEVHVVDWTLVATARAQLDRSEVPTYHLTFEPDSAMADVAVSALDPDRLVSQKHHEVIILGAADASGFATLDFCFRKAAFRTTCMSLSTLVKDPTILRRARGLAFVVDDRHTPGLAQAKILAVQIRSHLEAEFREFFRRPDTFSLGVGGGGGHVLTLLWDLVESPSEPSTTALPVAKRRRLNSAGTELPPSTKTSPPARPARPATAQHDDGSMSDPLSLPKLDSNISNRFECRWVHVAFPRSSASTVWTRDMEGSHFGCYLATSHGLLSLGGGSVSAPPMQLTRDGTGPCAVYPYSNGSEESACGVVSRDGRHMALSISPQLAVKRYQWPWWPQAWSCVQSSPWMKLFLNAHKWCVQERSDDALRKE